MTLYGVPPHAFTLNESRDALVLSSLFDQHLRAFRLGMKELGAEKITGCPAHTIKVDTAEGTSTTLLVQYWRDYVNAVYVGNPHEPRIPSLGPEEVR